MNVGDYVRTREGTIAKIESERDYTHGDYTGGENDFFLNVNHSYQDYERIIKSSPQIIDLIEVGDYVNGQKVQCFRKENCDYDIGFQYDDDWGQWYGIDFDDIKTIITHEQMEAMQYRVEK